MFGVITSNSSVTPNYFYDELSLIEANEIYKNIQKEEKKKYEHTRLLAYHSVLPYFKNETSIEKFMKLDNDEISEEISTKNLKKQKEDYENLVDKLNFKTLESQ